jgi:Icc-related predicted phosphoesterase
MKKQKKFKILAAGDFHGDSKATRELAERAYKEKVNLVILTGDITSQIQTENLLKPFKERGQKVVFVPGNWDSSETIDFLSKLYGIKNINDNYVVYDDVGIFGIGSPDWQMNLNEKKAFEKLKRDFDKIKALNLEKKIMVSHIHPAKTKAEFSGIPGSTALKKAINEFQPDIFLSGHIHEAEGLSEKIGKTRVYNVGRKGRIIEL